MRIIDRSKVKAPECCVSLTETLCSNLQYIKETDPYGLSHPEIAKKTLLQSRKVGIRAQQMIKNALFELFEGRCAYCEQPVTSSRAYIEQFRPRSGLTETKTGKYYPLHYSWLEFAWENLYLSCMECSNAKRNNFPIEGSPAPILSFGQQLKIESPLLLDPCDTSTDISEHLICDREGFLRPASIKGEVTIKLLKLNRMSLVEQRRISIRHKRIDNKAPFYGFVAQVLEQDIGSTTLKNPEYKEVTSSFNAFNTKIFDPKISEINLFNIGPLKGLKRIQVNVSGQDSWLMILGDNGAGKSTILKAITLALLGQDNTQNLIERLDVNPAELINHDSRFGFVRLRFEDQFPEITLKIGKDGSLEFSNADGFPIILNAYGSTRLAPTKANPSNKREEAFFVDNLFNHFEPLSNAQLVLNQLSDNERFYAANCLSSLFDLNSSLSLSATDSENNVVFKFANLEVPYNQLSDGFKSIITLFLDILVTSRRFGFENAEQFNGIILIDELGIHLHPKWRIRIVTELRAIFPKAQFICTTHEPLCLRGLDNDEIIVLKKDRNKPVTLIAKLPDARGMSSEQLLTSLHFGLHSTTDKSLNIKFARYYELLAQDSKSNECKLLQRELSDMGALRGLLGGTRREQLIYRAIDKMIAENENEDIEKMIDSATLADELSSLWKIS
ncbi:AAA family ATPase [Vibrio bivalvicida]|uniref:AAA+ ATPase domain-containing protein n=1 Tax=Vibrio bivalvicida TaxID=1276888 RepID=A0A177Y0V8_9VIBR|nr:AAA family ATPase [Vibrio bivalvicida]OAJ94447.1 hypothetical protein APB76_09710 [Vibrio bivalvicida]